MNIPQQVLCDLDEAMGQRGYARGAYEIIAERDQTYGCMKALAMINGECKGAVAYDG